MALPVAVAVAVGGAMVLAVTKMRETHIAEGHT
jgi:hypothetical protein